MRVIDEITVLVSYYDEKPTVEKVIRDLQAVLPEATVYIYDNNSTDDTYDIARKAGAVVRREPKQGKGNVLRTMFREIDADCYLLVDGDDTYPCEAAPELCAAVLEGRADMAVGDRLSSTYFTENKRAFHNSGNRIVRTLVNLFFNGKVVDIMTGYRALSYSFAKSFPILSSGFEIETEMTIHALDKNMTLVNVPVTYRDRPEGSISKLNTFSDGIKVLGTIFRLFRDYRPLAFFGLIIAAILVVLALALIFPIIVEFTKTGAVRRFPTLFMAGFISVSGLLSLNCGLILDSIAFRSRRDFEFKLQQIEHQKSSGR